ncbi:TetR/AcrR family transcriptional regulator [Sphingomonas bacterium]|uniref:TetR/AcrR family transcriptional regulator n=1 Tax=Sphingomonas bacterium TaxID=1895847 RepID=UPI0015752F3C|nr:TetR/AcrR family transcriptional regulator [Sphingomonas bacterium]
MKLCCPQAPAKGRPREFDLDEALTAALRVFWTNGYEAASMAELTAAMGITKPSLYAAFGNKEALFGKALDLYEREKLAYMKTALDAPTARGVAERLLRGGLEMHASSCNPKGCLSVISTMACGSETESIKDAVIARRASSEAAMVARFERAQAAGELPHGMTPAALVRYLLALMQGLAIQAGSGASVEQLEQLVETSLSIWPTAPEN